MCTDFIAVKEMVLQNDSQTVLPASVCLTDFQTHTNIRVVPTAEANSHVIIIITTLLIFDKRINKIYINFAWVVLLQIA